MRLRFALVTSLVPRRLRAQSVVGLRSGRGRGIRLVLARILLQPEIAEVKEMAAHDLRMLNGIYSQDFYYGRSVGAVKSLAILVGVDLDLTP